MKKSGSISHKKKAVLGFILCFSLLPSVYSVTKTNKKQSLSRFMHSGGPAAQGLGDKTGSPISSGTCGDCHSGGASTTVFTIQVFNALNTVVSSYIPGDTYTLHYSVSNSSFSQFGMQSVILDGSNANAGSFGTISTANSQITHLNGFQYFEQQGRSSSGFFTVSWTAPSTGSGPVSIYGIGLAVDGFSTSGDKASTPQSVTLTEAIQTSIDYSGTPYCANDTNPMPTVTGEQGGTFSSTSGLVINATTGEVDLTNSTSGAYTITYTGASTSATFDITIYPTYTISISDTICYNETYQLGTQTLTKANAGLNTELFTTVNGCDSLVTVDLTIDSVSDITTTISGMTISANNSVGTYQWLDCDNGDTVITGETNQSFTPATLGNYAVEITENGCIDTSTCVAVVTVGVIENNFENEVSVYPNPTHGTFTIDLGTVYENSHLSIIDVSGKLLDQKTFTQSQILGLSIEAPHGIYLVSVRSGEKKAVIWLVKE